MNNKEDFVRTLSAKLLAYGIGRGIEYYDQPAVREMCARSAANYRWSSLVVGIVNSAPFSMAVDEAQAPSDVERCRSEE